MVRPLHTLTRLSLLLAAVSALAGCVAYPGEYYGAPSYYAPGPTVVVPIAPRGYYGGGGGGYYGGGGYRGGYGRGWR